MKSKTLLVLAVLILPVSMAFGGKGRLPPDRRRAGSARISVRSTAVAAVVNSNKLAKVDGWTHDWNDVATEQLTAHARQNDSEAAENRLVMTVNPILTIGGLTYRDWFGAGGFSQYQPISAFNCSHSGSMESNGLPLYLTQLKGYGLSEFKAEGYVGGLKPVNEITHKVFKPGGGEGSIAGVIPAPISFNSFSWLIQEPDGTKITISGSVNNDGVSWIVNGVPHYKAFDDGVAVEFSVDAGNKSKISFNSSATISKWTMDAGNWSMSYGHFVTIANIDVDDEDDPPSGGSGGGIGPGSEF